MTFPRLIAFDPKARAPQGGGRFNRAALPDPLAFYPAEGLALSPRGAWRDALCPFHGDTRPSLRVNAETGAYRCMRCGERGGDVLAFYMARHGASFTEAAQALGAWEGGR